jgi:hypothetical protein
MPAQFLLTSVACNQAAHPVSLPVTTSVWGWLILVRTESELPACHLVCQRTVEEMLTMPLRHVLQAAELDLTTVGAPEEQSAAFVAKVGRRHTVGQLP